MSPEEAVEKVGSVVEGYYTSEAVAELADRYSVEMPVCKATNLVLKGEIPPKEAVGLLMSRGKKDELQ
jgi:glycerol-3-phosphate dehydrogenase (NAD(P)+)